ncbi:MAG: hypothetical protein J6A01_07235, partial [Proteobacteria bacterium]|nr:hypothetical protein [Pseudomonadota bacterium]
MAISKQWFCFIASFGLAALSFCGCGDDSSDKNKQTQEPPDHCVDGVCGDVSDCPSACPGNCTNGVCNDAPSDCPEECPGNCTNGVCNDAPSDCPEECPGNCTNGVCNDAPLDCPEECPGNCTNGVCNDAPSDCPEECPDNCTNGVCNEEMISCPETCKTSCDADGRCECPENCPNACNENGECLPMCGDEVIKEISFPAAETDILKPGSPVRTSSLMPLNIKTNKNDKEGYTLEDAPCADEIEFSLSDSEVAAAEKNGKYIKITSKKVGTTTCEVHLKNNPEVNASFIIHVLDLDNLKENLETGCKNSVCPHVYKSNMILANKGITQGFDFLNAEETFLTQLGVGETYKVKVDLDQFDYCKTEGSCTNDAKVKYSKVRLLLMKHLAGNAGKFNKLMTFRQACHGQNIAVEKQDDKEYVWVSNYGTFRKCEDKTDYLDCTTGYSYSQTLSRVEWTSEDVAYYPDDKALTHYYYSDSDEVTFYSFEPGLDQKNNRFALIADCTKSNKIESDCVYADLVPSNCGNIDSNGRYIRMFALSDVLDPNITKDKERDLSCPRRYIDENNEYIDELQLKKRTHIKYRDLSAIKVLDSFDVKNFPSQGFDIDNGILYAIEGWTDKKT